MAGYPGNGLLLGGLNRLVFDDQHSNCERTEHESAASREKRFLVQRVVSRSKACLVFAPRRDRTYPASMTSCPSRQIALPSAITVGFSIIQQISPGA